MPPKKDISLEVLAYKADQNMIDHAEIKLMIKDLSDIVVNGMRAQDDKIQRQEEKFIMRKEARAVSGVIGFLVLVLGAMLSFFKL